jgi:N-acetyl-gamma-glutamyl-phosphate reductase
MAHKQFTVGIIGGSGYTGAELLRLLKLHPFFKVDFATAHSEAENKINDVYPYLMNGYEDISFISQEAGLQRSKDCDLVFLALPHGESMCIVEKLASKKIVDLASDFRLRKPEEYEYWYKKTHQLPRDLDQWVYSLPEIHKEKVKNVKKIANPGCFATSVILALAPLVDKTNTSVKTSHRFVVDAMSGLSGAGKSFSKSLHFSHAFENTLAYKFGSHQHVGEIQQALTDINGTNVEVSLTTHLVPMARGIYSTCTVDLMKSSEDQKVVTSNTSIQSSLYNLFKTYYSKCPFVKVLQQQPCTKDVRGSNYCHIYPYFEERTKRVIVMSVIDNLVKGASGQAIQNANIFFDLEETTGLEQIALYP